MKTKELDLIFEALGNAHRREIVYALGLQPYSISQLASQQKLTLPAIHKHIEILKIAGLIKSKKLGRTNFLTINRSSLKNIQEWLNEFQAHWGTDNETLENYAQFLKKKE